MSNIRSSRIMVGVIISLFFFMGSTTVQADPKTIYVARCIEADLNKALAMARDYDTIKFKCDGVIRLTGVKKIARSITIDASDRKITLDGQRKTGILEIATGADVRLKRITFAHAGFIRNESWEIVSKSLGHAILNQGTLTIDQSTFFENTAALPTTGGAIENYGSLIVNNSYFAKNATDAGPGPRQTSGGGALSNLGGTAVISNTTFIDNISGHGGAIFNSGTLSVFQSLFTQNVAGTYGCDWCGGAIANGNMSYWGRDPLAMLYLKNSTIYANRSYGIINQGVATIVSSTIAQNAVVHGGGLFYSNTLSGGVLTLHDTIVASGVSGLPAAAPEMDGNCGQLWHPYEYTSEIIDGGNNLQYPENSCGKTILVGDPMLTPLSAYGSSASQGADRLKGQLLGLQPGSPAIDKGHCLFDIRDEFDGRGFSRATDGKCDIGAFEYGAIPRENLPTPTASPSTF
jgi:hypothetical protein